MARSKDAEIMDDTTMEKYRDRCLLKERTTVMHQSVNEHIVGEGDDYEDR